MSPNGLIVLGVVGMLLIAVAVPPFAPLCIAAAVIFALMGRAGDAVQESADKALAQADSPAARAEVGAGGSCALLLITAAAVGALLLAAGALAPLP